MTKQEKNSVSDEGTIEKILNQKPFKFFVDLFFLFLEFFILFGLLLGFIFHSAMS